ncbi:MAG: ribonuclease toxin immunity protein CdiI [Thermoactinomyces sp.]
MYNTEEDNFKMMESMEEINDFIDIYFSIVGDYNFIKCLKGFRNKAGFGIEDFGILFKQDFDDDEWVKYRCKENEVALLMYYPEPDQNRITFLDFHQFYPYLYQYGQKFIRKHPEKKEEVTYLLKEIKESWGI